ncbi:MAG: ImmA/IrrE family metallo-endopeptidase [Alphaproteobacteria bacterium]|nr:ImmA/IrrE family metallo-endopeptidase [Alphaproteobacteria bacterium]
MRNIIISNRTARDIDEQVAKVLKGLGDPEPPLDLRLVRELLRLDKQYYSSSASGPLAEKISRLKVAGKQVIERPTLLFEAIRKLDLKALYLPDRKRILLDKNLPALKHRWNEAHEIGHSIIEWHADSMLGDDQHTLRPECQERVEAEANYAAGQMLFLQERFSSDARDVTPSIASVLSLKERFGNTITTTMWRFIERSNELPMVGMISGHPSPACRKPDFNPLAPCRYLIRSPAFAARFSSLEELPLFQAISSYCSAQRRGYLGKSQIVLTDDNGDRHLFNFETFFNTYEALTLGVYRCVDKSGIYIAR